MSALSTRLAKLEQRNNSSASITRFIKDGWQFIGGSIGCLRVPVTQSAFQWDADYKEPEGNRP